MRQIKSFLILISVIIAFAIPAQAQETAGPNLWRVGDEDTTIYIFGTIHILNQDVNWVTPQLTNAFSEANILILEMAPDQEDPAVMNPLIGKYGMLPPGKTLKTILSSYDYSILSGNLNMLGADGQALDAFQPWLAAVILTVQVAAGHGFLPEYGVEKILQQSAEDNDMPILGLETAEYQISIFGNMSEENQKIFLTQTLDELNKIEELFIEMRDAWLAGDIESLDKMLNEGVDEIPGFAEAMLYKRNRNWTQEIKNLLDVPGTYLMAVGTGHLVGQQNLLELLEAEGIPVSLVE